MDMLSGSRVVSTSDSNTLPPSYDEVMRGLERNYQLPKPTDIQVIKPPQTITQPTNEGSLNFILYSKAE